jgi:two-component system cell cycle sensor histidine kinase/response regulator CckA
LPIGTDPKAFRIFDEMFEGVQILDGDLRYIYLNRAAASHGRRQLEQLLGQRMVDSYPGIETTEVFSTLRRAMAERTPQQIMNRFVYPDGHHAWFDIRITPIQAGVMVLSIDISVQKQIEEDLRTSRHDLAITLESMPDAVITTDAQRCITRMNPAAEQLTGWAEDEARGRAVHELLGFLNQRSGERVDDVVQRVLLEGSRIGLANDTLLITRHGKRIPIASSGAPLRDDDDTIRGVVFVLRNMSEEYELLAMLHQSQKMEAIGRLAGGVAHDFNNLLTVILGSAEIALETSPEDKQLCADLEDIRDAAQRAIALTRQLLAFSRKEPVKTEMLDVNRVIARSQSMLTRVIGETISLELKLEPGLPAVKFDAVQLEQIIMNLVVNARDALPAGGRIVVQTERHGHDVALVISDNGTGMADETMNRAFEPFFTTKPPGYGTGLGLATTYSIVTQSGGEIRAESELGHGSTFTLILRAS